MILLRQICSHHCEMMEAQPPPQGQPQSDGSFDQSASAAKAESTGWVCLLCDLQGSSSCRCTALGISGRRQAAGSGQGSGKCRHSLNRQV